VIDSVNLGSPVNWGHPLNRGLVGCWLPLPNNANGSRLFDLTGRSHGTLTNSVTWAAGPNGFGSVSVVNGTTNYVEIAGSGGWGADGPQTYEVLYRPTYSIGAIYRGVLAQGTAGNQLQMVNFTDGNFYAGHDGGNRVVIAATSLLTQNVWVHLVLVLGSAVTAQHILYRNGEQVGTAGSAGAAFSWSDTTLARIGNNNANSTDGQIACVRRYSRALSASEVWGLYQQSALGYPDTLNWTRFRPHLLATVSSGTPATATTVPASWWLYQPANLTATGAATTTAVPASLPLSQPPASASGAATTGTEPAAFSLSGPPADATGAASASTVGAALHLSQSANLAATGAATTETAPAALHLSGTPAGATGAATTETLPAAFWLSARGAEGSGAAAVIAETVATYLGWSSPPADATGAASVTAAPAVVLFGLAEPAASGAAAASAVPASLWLSLAGASGTGAATAQAAACYLSLSQPPAGATGAASATAAPGTLLFFGRAADAQGDPPTETTLAALIVTRDGVSLTDNFGGAASSVYWLNNGAEYLVVKNDSGSAVTVTLDYRAQYNRDDPSDRSVVVQSGKTVVIGPFPQPLYNDSSQRARVAFSATSGVNVALVRTS